MITFKEFILDGSNDIKELILTNCGSFLFQCGGEIMYRGMNGINLKQESTYNEKPIQWDILTSKTDRAPKNTELLVSGFIDDYFEEKFGWKARSSGTFVTGNDRYASDYGHPYMIFPIGKFNFVWSERVKDLFFKTPSVDGPYHTSDEALRARTYEVLDNGEYKNTDLEAALTFGNEIMVQCNRYYAVQINRAFFDDVYDTYQTAMA